MKKVTRIEWQRPWYGDARAYNKDYEEYTKKLQDRTCKCAEKAIWIKRQAIMTMETTIEEGTNILRTASYDVKE
jgi:hypothetical protein